jgi:hypothetical protein
MHRVLLIPVFAIALVALSAAPQVRADGVDTFTLTESFGDSVASLVWQLPASPILDSSSYTDTGFTIGADSVSYFLDGNFLYSFSDTLTFSNTDAGGGVNDSLDRVFFALSTAQFDQFYLGGESNSTFAPGTYQVTNAFDSLPGTLVISTPEPSALTLFCVGLCAMLFLSFRKKVFV